MQHRKQSDGDGRGPTRRTLLQGLSLGGLSLLAGSLPLARWSTAALAREGGGASTSATFKVGSFEVTVVSDGTMTLPLSFALPGRDPAEVNALLATGGLPPDMVLSQINVAIVRTPDALILVDTGGGTDFMPTLGKLPDHLETTGITPDQITHVVFTHAHADHLWGVIDSFEGGSRFTKARHLMTEAEHAYWTKPGLENDVPAMFRTMAVGSGRRLKELGDRIDRVKPGTDIVPGVHLVDSAGHTTGHASVLLRSGTEQLLIGGDALTHPVVSFANPGWRWGPDMEPDKAIATRQRLLQMLAAEKTALLGYHLPWPGLGRVEAKGTAWRFVQE